MQLLHQFCFVLLLTTGCHHSSSSTTTIRGKKAIEGRGVDTINRLRYLNNGYDEEGCLLIFLDILCFDHITQVNICINFLLYLLYNFNFSSRIYWAMNLVSALECILFWQVSPVQI